MNYKQYSRKNLYGEWIEAMYFDARRVDFVIVGFEGPGPTLGNLASAGVPRAKKQKFRH